MGIEGVKNYLTETTIHGLRYIVESKTFVERVIWLLACLTAFTYSTFFIISSINEAKNDPIMSTVEIVEGKDIDFPALTIFTPPPNVSPSYRFVTDVLNALPFKCGFYETCSEIELKSRQDYRPLLKSFVRAVMEAWKLKNKDRRHRQKVDELEYMYGKERLLILQLCRLHATQAKGLSFEEEDMLIEKLLDSPELSDSGWEEEPVLMYLAELSTPQQGEENNITCGPIQIQNSPFGYLFDTVLMVKELLPQSNLGDLLEYSYNFVSAPVGGTILDQNNRDEKISDFPDKILLGLEDYEEDLTINECLTHLDLTLPMNSVQESFEEWLGPNGTCHKLEDQKYSLSRIFQNCLKGQVEKHLIKALKFAKYLHQPASYPIKLDTSYYSDAKNAWDFSENQGSCLENNTCKHSDPIVGPCHMGLLEPEANTGIWFVEQNCPDFEVTFGYKGLRYAFNSNPFWETYQKHNYQEAFYNEIVKQNRRGNSTISSDTKIDFYILPTSYQLYRVEQESITLAIHHPLQIPFRGIKLEPGNLYTITVTPSMITTDTDLKDLPIESRGCKFNDEIDNASGDHIFKYYSHSTCMIECKIKKGFAARNCTPYNLPHFESPVSICGGGEESWEFFKKFDSTSEEDCDCPPDCDIYSYGTDIAKEKMQYCMDIHCDGVLEFLSGLTDGYVYHDPCKEGCHQNIIRVIVRVDTSAVVNTKRRRRSTTTDQIASLGGLVGLFTGMSMLSVAELIMWLVRCFATAALGKLTKKKQTVKTV